MQAVVLIILSLLFALPIFSSDTYIQHQHMHT
jgi:hypothetical protein